MNKFKIIFYVATGLFTALMLFSASNYFFQTAVIQEAFTGFGYPSYLVIPLGVAKLLGLAAIWFAPKQFLKEWAYAGFFFNVVLAFFAHTMIGDGQSMGAVIALVLLLTSYWSSTKV
ncbi:MAG: DoxX family protein [Bacteroidota bacterium]